MAGAFDPGRPDRGSIPFTAGAGRPVHPAGVRLPVIIDVRSDAREGGDVRAAGARGTPGRGVRTERDLLRRTLSQNFLREPAAGRFLDVLDLDPDGLVVEVGAGEGALTGELARRSRAVVAYEVDPRLAARLAGTLRGQPGVRIVAGDFLAAAPPAEPFHLVGNVPFGLT